MKNKSSKKKTKKFEQIKNNDYGVIFKLIRVFSVKTI